MVFYLYDKLSPNARVLPFDLVSMVNLKTKVDKHTNDNEKRRKSIKEKEKRKSTQSEIIKQALSCSTLNNSSGKKIIFDDADDVEYEQSSNNRNNSSKNGKSELFESSESETEDFQFREKSQFSGKKGFELLNLQSTYGNDDRFKIDERFLEEEKEDTDEGSPEGQNETDTGGEKVKQLKILESVLGTSLVGTEKENKRKKTTEMVRYDASNKDHEIYEINNQPKVANLTPSKKRKEGKKTLKTDKEELPTPKVSKEKFYEVSNEIKNRFKEKNDESGQFSLLQTYGVKNDENNEEMEEDSENELAEYQAVEEEQNYKLDMEDEIQDKVRTEKTKVQEKSTTAKGIWKESFFFVEEDPRFKEGIDFINKKNSKEASEAAENYDKTRKQLKEILRLHLKKQMHKKDPFKNKIGGMNKKQLAGSRSKNHRVTFNGRKPPKKNLDWRT